MIEMAIKKLANREDIGYDMAMKVADEIMGGQASPVQISSYLTALSLKGETIEEITGSAKGMRQHETVLPNSEDTLEIVGTGGDGASSINISTISAIITAAAGIKVAKHGNRAASSKCGTADCLESLGVNISLGPDENLNVLEQTGMCFLFAQRYHMAMKNVGPVRKELGIRTIFNILGPLANPANASLQLLGVFSEKLVEPLAQVLKNLGLKRFMVVYGRDGFDEISVSDETLVCEYDGAEFHTYTIQPEDFGFQRAKKADVVGGTPGQNAEILKEILKGAKGAKTDIVLLNAGAAIHVARPEYSMAQGIELAREMIESGKAYEKLEEFIRVTNEQKAS